MKRSLVWLAAAATLALAGCGGGQHQTLTTSRSTPATGDGTASVRILWPATPAAAPNARGHLIPAEAQYVRIGAYVVNDPGGRFSPGTAAGVLPAGVPASGQPPLPSGVVQRPFPATGSSGPVNQVSNITIAQLPVGTTIRFVAESFANAPPVAPDTLSPVGGATDLDTGGGAPLTAGTNDQAITAGQAASFHVTMGYTITHVAVALFNAADTAPLGATPVTFNSPFHAHAAAEDANDNLVLVPSANLTWGTGGVGGNLTLGSKLGTDISVRPVAGGQAQLVVTEAVTGATGASATFSISGVPTSTASAGGFINTAIGGFELVAGDVTVGASGPAYVVDNGGNTDWELHYQVSGGSSSSFVLNSPAPTLGTGQAVPDAVRIAQNTDGVAVGLTDPTKGPTVTTYQIAGSPGTAAYTTTLPGTALLDVAVQGSFTYALVQRGGTFVVYQLDDANNGVVAATIPVPAGLSPARVAVDEGKDIYLTQGNSGLAEMDSTGTLLSTFAVQGGTEKQFDDISYDGGLLYALDKSLNSVFVYGPTGAFLFSANTFSFTGSPGVALDNPAAMAAFQGHIYVSESSSDGSQAVVAED